MLFGRLNWTVSFCFCKQYDYEINKQVNFKHNHWSVAQTLQLSYISRAVMRSPLEWKGWGSNLGPIKSDTVANVSPPLRHFLERSCVVCRRNGAGIGPAKSLHASPQYSEYNENLICKMQPFLPHHNRITISNGILSLNPNIEINCDVTK